MQLFALILAVAAYWRLLRFDPQPQEELLRELEEWFFEPTDTSPMVVVLLAGWLLYRRRDGWLPLIGRDSSPLVAFLLAGFAVAAHAWSRHVGAADLLTFSLIGSLLAVAALLAGRPGLRAVSIPAFFLLFAVPFPGPLLNAVIYRFQLWTAEYAGSVLTAFGLPAFVANDQILLAADHFEVIEGCSGLRSVQTLTMVSVLLVDLFGRRGVHAATIVVLAPFVAFALNGVRVMTLILNPTSEIAAVHNIQGVAILLAGVMILYGVDGLFERFIPGSKRAAESDVEVGETAETPPVESLRKLRSAFPLALMGLLALISVLVPDGSREPARKRVVERQLAVGAQIADRSWDRTSGDTDGAFLGTLGRLPYIDFWFEREAAETSNSDGKRPRNAADDPDAVRFFFMQGDAANRLYSAVSSKTRYPESGWEIEARGVHQLPEALTPESGEREVEWLVLRSGTRRQLAVHWRSGDLGFARETWRALLGLDARASVQPREVRVFRVSTQLRRGDPASRAAGLRRIDVLLEALAPRLRDAEFVGNAPGGAPRNFRSAIVPERKIFSSVTSSVFQETQLKQCVTNRHVACTTVPV